MNEPRVLIIEDNDALRVMLFTLLRHQPLSVDVAASADEALEKVSACDYALIIVDMELRDSAPFLRRFRERRSEATTFVLAVRNPREEPVLDADLVDAVLSKPLEIDMLAEVVRECALVVPPPDDPLPCPPSDSEVRERMERSGSFYSN